MQKSIYMKRFEESWGVEVEKSWGYNPWNSRIEGVMDEETAGVGGHIKSSIADHVLVPKRVWEYSPSWGYNPWMEGGVMAEEEAGVGGHIRSSIADQVLVPKRVWEYSSSWGWTIDETLTVTGESYTEIVIN